MTIERAAATADDTLDQTTDTLIDGLTLTPASGDYLLFSTVEFQSPSSQGTEEKFFNVYVGGTLIDHSERQYDGDTSVDLNSIVMMLTCKVSPNGTQAVEVRMRASASTAPLVAKKREMNLFPISGTDVQVTATADTTLPTPAWTDLMTMTTPASGDYLLTFSTSGEGPTDAELRFRATVGGVVVAHSVRQTRQENSSFNDHVPIGMAISVSPDGTQDVVIQWSASTGTITVSERTMNLIPTAAADIFQATGTADNVDTTTTDKQVDDMLIVDPGAADYLAIYTSSEFYGSIASGGDAECTYSIQEGGVRVTDSERINEHESSLDSINLTCHAGGRITVAAATDDVQMFWQGSTTLSRTARERTLVLLREATATDTELNGGASPGSFIKSGIAATLLVGSVIAALAGAYGVTGALATTEVGRVLDGSAGPGAIAVTGVTATTLKASVIDASAGSLIVTGLAATTELGRLLLGGAEVGSLIITGDVAATLKGTALNAIAGSHALSGAALTSLVGRVIDVSAGSLAISGLATTLLKDIPLFGGATAGALSLTGQPATTLTGLLLSADAGSLVITGLAATTIGANLLDAVSGVLAITGAPATTLVERALSANAGLYSATGLPLTTLVGQLIEVVPATYVIGGAPVTILIGRVIPALPDTYTISGQALTTVFSGGVSIVEGTLTVCGNPVILTLFT